MMLSRRNRLRKQKHEIRGVTEHYDYESEGNKGHAIGRNAEML